VEILFSANFDRFQIENGKRFYLVEKQSKIDIYSQSINQKSREVALADLRKRPFSR